MLEEWVKELTFDMMSDGTSKEIAEVIGTYNLLKLSERFGGSDIYIPKLDRILIPLRNRLILKEFNGGNNAALARKYHLSCRRVQTITSTITNIEEQNRKQEDNNT